MLKYEVKPEMSKCKHCGEDMVTHMVKAGAYYHVISWLKTWDSVNERYDVKSVCSDPDCEHNHGPGYCVPYEKD